MRFTLVAWAGMVMSPVSQDVSGVVANGLFMTSQSLLSPVYINQHVESCFILLRQPIACALPLALDNAGSNSAARMAMIAMTTSNSIKVKPVVRLPLSARSAGSTALIAVCFCCRICGLSIGSILTEPARSGKSHQGVQLSWSPVADGQAPNEMKIQGSFQLESTRSEEHTSELQSRQYLVCRLLL